MMMFGGVPIRVMVPPSSDPNAKDISSKNRHRPDLRDIQISTGIKCIRATSLLINAEQSDTTRVRVITCNTALRPTLPSSRATASTTPPLTSPRLMTSTAATVITAGWPKPANNWSDGTSPAIATASKASMDTTSKRSRFQTNSPRVMPSTRDTIHWSDSIKSLLHFDVRVDNIYKPDGQICRPYRQASETREGSRTGSKPACNLLKDSAALNPGRPQGRGRL